MPGRISCPTLVGREGELQRILAHLAGESPALLVVRGDAGIGKTRLLDEALGSARAGGATVLAGACIPFAGRRLPFGPILDALRIADDGPAATGLVALRADLRRVVDAAPLGEDDGVSHARVLNGAVDALELAAGESVVVLSVDDLHWSDAPTRDLLLAVASSRRSARVRLVATLRTDEEHEALKPMLAELTRAGLLDVLDLQPLGVGAVDEQVTGILGAPPARTLLDAVARRSGGNPFFVEELVAAARGGDAVLPPSVGEVLLVRLASLPDDVLALLRTMAVLGDSVPDALLAAVSDDDPATVAARLRTAEDAHVVRIDRRAGTYAFRHALMREVLYADLLAGERTAMHEAVARILESDRAKRLLSPMARSLALAVHWDEAGDVARAIPALVAGAQAATAANAHADALELYRRCLRRLADDPSAVETAGSRLDELYARAAHAAFLADDTGMAIDLARRAVELAGTDDAARSALLHQRLCEYLWEHGAGVESLDIARRAYEVVPATADPAIRAAVVGFWASALCVLSRYEEAIPVAEECIEIGRALSDPATIGLGLACRGAAVAGLVDVEAGARDCAEAIEIARTSSEADTQLIAYMNGSWVIGVLAGDAERALALVADWQELQRRSGLERTRGMWMAGFAGDLLLRLGRWDEADEVLSEALRLPFRGPSRHEVVANAAIMRTWQGRLEEADALAREALALAAHAGTLQFTGLSHAIAVDVALWRGDTDRAVELVDAAMPTVDATEDPLYTRHFYAAAARACIERRERLRGRRSESEREALIRRAESFAQRARYAGVLNVTARAPETRAWTAQAAAEVARATATLTAAEEWDRTRDAWHAVGDRAHEAYSALRSAEASLACGQRGRAAESMRAARELAATIGAEAVVRSADALAERARLRPAGAAGATTGFGLTVRELEVLDLVARGLTNREIAATLFISEKTAGVHVSNILAKLDVTSRAQAAAIAVRHEQELAKH
ncbi:MAG TPA: AAA family ATPase [Candidatus Limnocylindria bacterium]|nr:AAA family ATPase [Candidatus Limnocylindria bacterium]